jgi:hypothetical protein
VPKKHHVFLSYSRIDIDIMQRVKQDLRNAGLKVWTDEGIEPGTFSWKEAIEDAIRDTEMLVVLLSPDANNSKWVQREIDYADVQDVQVMPILVRGEPRDSVPFALAGSQFIDLRTNYEPGIKTLISRCYDYMQKTGGVTVEHKRVPRNILPPRHVMMYVGGGIAAIGLLMLLAFGFSFLPVFNPTETPSPTPTYTPTIEAAAVVIVATATSTPSNTPTFTASPTVATATPTQTSTATETYTPSPSPTPSGELQLRYNRNTLVVHNRTDAAATILGLEFVLISEGGTERYTFNASEWADTDSRLLAQQCVQVWRTEFSQLPISVPPANVCEARTAFKATIREFWIAEWDNAVFEVRRYDILLATCAAVNPRDDSIQRCIVDV